MFNYKNLLQFKYYTYIEDVYIAQQFENYLAK